MVENGIKIDDCIQSDPALYQLYMCKVQREKITEPRQHKFNYNKALRSHIYLLYICISWADFFEETHVYPGTHRFLKG